MMKTVFQGAYCSRLTAKQTQSNTALHEYFNIKPDTVDVGVLC